MEFLIETDGTKCYTVSPDAVVFLCRNGDVLFHAKHRDEDFPHGDEIPHKVTVELQRIWACFPKGTVISHATIAKRTGQRSDIVWSWNDRKEDIYFYVQYENQDLLFGIDVLKRMSNSERNLKIRPEVFYHLMAQLNLEIKDSWKPTRFIK